MQLPRLAGIFVVLGAFAVGCSDNSASNDATNVSTNPVVTSSPGRDSTNAASTEGSGSSTSAASEPAAGGTESSGYYVALGDSYAVGYLAGVGPSNGGYVDGVVAAAADSGRELQLVNFGCSGATSASLVGTAGCDSGSLAPGAAPYDSATQLDAAVGFLEDHPGEVALITVSVGGNDVFPCAITSDTLVECARTTMTGVVDNLTVALGRLRAAAPDARIVGTTYPDIALGAWTTPFPGAKDRAVESIAAFRDVINPALRDAYAAVAGRFVDVTEATGGYGSMDETTSLEPYGVIPTPVAQVCELTAFCSNFDIHPTPAGYDLIAGLVLEQFLA